MPKWITGIEVAMSPIPPKGDSCLFYFMKVCKSRGPLKYLPPSNSIFTCSGPNTLTAHALVAGIRD